MSIESVMPSSHLILCHPFLLLPPIPPSIRVFSNESTLLMRWPKYWNFSFSISPSNEHPGLISFRMDWLDLLAVQGTLESLLQHHSSKASILRCSAFFTVQLSHPYMTIGKTIALTRRIFVGKVMSLLLNMPSRSESSPPKSSAKWSQTGDFFPWLCWVFVAAPHASSSYSNRRLRSGCGVQVSYCGGFSCCGAQALGHVGFSSGGVTLGTNSLK